MKNTFVVLAALLCFFLFCHCSKRSSCRCTEYDALGANIYDNKTINPDSYGVENCEELESVLSNQALFSGNLRVFRCVEK